MQKNTYWVVEDREKHRQEIEKLIKSVDTSPEFRLLNSYDEVVSACDNEVTIPTAIVLDYMLGPTEQGFLNGISALQKIRKRFPIAPVFMLTGESDLKHVLKRLNILLKYGLLNNYFEKTPEERKRLKIRIEHLLMEQSDDSGILDWTESLGKKSGRPVGKVGWIYRDLSRKAILDIPVLIQGPSGSGKEMIAHMIHDESFRNPFIPVNCSAIPDDLFESEFYGYVKGAFTGAEETKEGYFLLANKGTLFLDEVANLRPLAQAKLLRALEDGFYMVGGKEKLKPDVRIISATHKDLQEMVRRGEFRHDLYYRICGIYYPTYGVKDPRLSSERHAENLKLFIERCLAEHYEDRKRYFQSHKKQICNELTQLQSDSPDMDNVRKMAAEIVTTRLNELKVFFKADSNLMLDNNKKELLEKAFAYLGIPYRIPEKVWDSFISYSWPGNYREVRSVINTVIVEGGWEYAKLENLGESNDDSIQSYFRKASEFYLSHPMSDGHSQSDISPSDFKQQAENELFRHAIKICNGNLNNIANMLHVSTSTVSKNEIYKGRKD